MDMMHTNVLEPAMIYIHAGWGEGEDKPYSRRRVVIRLMLAN